MKSPFRFSRATRRLAWQLLTCGVVAGIAFTGCDSGDAPSSSITVSVAATAAPDEGVWRETARAILAGRAFDRAVWARRSENDAAWSSSIDELHRLHATRLADSLTLRSAEGLVARAMTLDGDAQRLPEAERQKGQADAAQLYRESLRLSPDFPSDNPRLLNALGYFLADRGTSPRDFADAERLTRASLQRYDAILTELAARPADDALSRLRAVLQGEAARAPLSENDTKAVRAERAIGPHDSLAWALFRQGRLSEALREQKSAIVETVAAAPDDPGLADLRAHLGQILRASGQEAAAREQFQKALQLDPEHEPSQRALQKRK